MSDKSAIEWTDATWNPTRGCVEISPGCDHCYARTFAERWRGVPGHAYEQGFDLRLVPEKLAEPIRWTRPRRVFVDSMSDLFQKGVPHDYIDQVFATMGIASWHTFQVLTKRPARALRWAERAPGRVRDVWALRTVDRFWPGLPFPNVQIGVSVEDRRHGLPRVRLLRDIPAAVRFLSIEPLLEELGPLDLSGIGWVIVGGESGPGARPMDPEWVRAIRDQCVAERVPFFFKQWGGLLKKRTGRVLDGRTWDEFPRAVA